MDFDQLETFIEVTRLSSFSRAAEKRFRTQPAISSQIRSLEEEVGAKLLDRSGGKVSLTASGKLFLRFAEDTLDARKAAMTAIAETERVPRGEIVVGANEGTCLHILPEVFANFKKQYPDVSVNIKRADYAKVLESVIDNTVDFGVVSLPVTDNRLTAVAIHKDELVLIMSPKHPLAGRSSVKVKDLGKESFVAHNVKSGSRLKVIEAFARQHTPLNITIELATIETIKRFVQKKVGVAFVPRMCVREELERGVLASVPVRGLTHNRILWAAHRRGSNFSPAAAAFLKVLKQHTSTTV